MSSTTRSRVAAAALITSLIAWGGVGTPAFAQDHYRGHDFDRGEPPLRLDQRYHHDHYYPARGYAFSALPRDSVRIGYRGGDYYYHGGVWLRPDSGRFIVAAPPFGVVVPVLPPSYATVTFGGAPYYYANGVYYAQESGQGYTVVAPPQGAEADGDVGGADPGYGPSSPAAPQYDQQAPGQPYGPQAPGQPYGPQAPGQSPYGQQPYAPQPSGSSGEPVVYPRNNQPPQQVAADRTDCYRWATQQSVGGNAAVYQRAFGACMDGKGYSVR